MRITLDISDDLGAMYEEEAVATSKSIQEVLANRLERAGDLHPQKRYLILAGRTRERLEMSLGGIFLKDTEDLIARVGRLAKIGFGEHLLTLSAGQLEELKWRATKRGKTIEQMLKEAWDRFAADFFTLVK